MAVTNQVSGEGWLVDGQHAKALRAEPRAPASAGAHRSMDLAGRQPAHWLVALATEEAGDVEIGVAVRRTVRTRWSDRHRLALGHPRLARFTRRLVAGER